MKKFKIFIYISLLLVIIGSLISLYIYFDIIEKTVDFTKSKYTLIKELDSPNGDNTALAFIYNGGATTDWQVTVLLKNSLFKNRGTSIFWANHTNNIDIEWTDDKTLKVKHNIDTEDIYTDEAEFKGINVIHEIDESITKLRY